MDLREEAQPHMDVNKIHEILKIALSPESYVKLLELMIEDVLNMIKWGEANKTEVEK
mgnify:FL=1